MIACRSSIPKNITKFVRAVATALTRERHVPTKTSAAALHWRLVTRLGSAKTIWKTWNLQWNRVKVLTWWHYSIIPVPRAKNCSSSKAKYSRALIHLAMGEYVYCTVYFACVKTSNASTNTRNQLLAYAGGYGSDTKVSVMIHANTSVCHLGRIFLIVLFLCRHWVGWTRARCVPQSPRHAPTS